LNSGNKTLFIIIALVGIIIKGLVNTITTYNNVIKTVFYKIKQKAKLVLLISLTPLFHLTIRILWNKKMGWIESISGF
jgi:hypothetical protein